MTEKRTADRGLKMMSLSELNAEHARGKLGTEENTEKSTEDLPDVHTEIHTSVQTDGGKDALPYVHPPTQTAVQMPVSQGTIAPTLPPVSTAAMPHALQPAQTPIQAPVMMAGLVSDQTGILADVTAKASEPVVRKTIDLPASLASRLTRYCADHNIKVEKRLFVALLDRYLKEGGY